MTNSPIRWFGGKGLAKRKIIPVLERIPHTRYVEPFGGGASILMAKRPVVVETYNDIDKGLYDLFRVLADPDLFAQFARRVALLPYSRQLYNDCLESWRDETDLIKRVTMWFVVARQSFGGRFGAGWGSVVTTSGRGMARTSSDWIAGIDRLPEVHARLARVQVENADWRDVLARYDTQDTLFYLDPPYVPATRSKKKYSHEMTAADHVELVAALLAIEGKAVLSGYPNEIYNPLVDAGWRLVSWDTSSYAAGRTRHTGIQGQGAAMDKQPRTECLWISPNAEYVRQMIMFTTNQEEQ